MARGLLAAPRELWNRHGDRVLFALLAVLGLLWVWYYAIHVPTRLDTRESATLPVGAERTLETITPFPENARIEPSLETKPLDVILALDVSGSMGENDPERLAMTSARMFVDLLPRDSRAGVILFNAGIAVQQPLTELAAADETRELRETFAYPYNAGTNIDLALERARALLSASPPDRRRVILFMTDAESPAIRDVRGELAEEDIVLFPIGFGDAVVPQVFEAMSYEAPRMVDEPEQLPDTFAEILAMVRDSKPFEPEERRGRYAFAAGTDTVDLSLVLISEQARALRPRLFSPAGEVELSRAREGIGIGRDDEYLVIRIDEQLVAAELREAGSGADPTWTLETPEQPERILVIPTYSVFLRGAIGAFDPVAKAGRVEEIALVDPDGAAIDQPSAVYSVVLDGPEGRYVHRLEQEVEPGVYAGQVPFGAPGAYRFSLEVETPSFTRSSEAFEFEYAEEFVFAPAPAEPVDLGVVPQGALPAVELTAPDPSLYNERGDEFGLRITGPGAEGGDHAVALHTRTANLSSGDPRELVVLDTDRPWPFVSRGTPAGTHALVLEVSHSSGARTSIPLQLRLSPLGPLEYWMPAITAATLVVLAVVIVVGRARYTPFPRAMTVVPFSDDEIQHGMVRHPGNRWLFGRPAYRLPGAPDYEVVPRGSSRLALRHPEEHDEDASPDSARGGLRIVGVDAGKETVGGYVEREFAAGSQLVRVGEDLFYFGVYRRSETDELVNRCRSILRRAKLTSRGRLLGVDIES